MRLEKPAAEGDDDEWLSILGRNLACGAEAGFGRCDAHVGLSVTSERAGEPYVVVDLVFAGHEVDRVREESTERTPRGRANACSGGERHGREALRLDADRRHDGVGGEGSQRLGEMGGSSEGATARLA